MNLKFVLAYDGSLYKGSQRQPTKDSVEDALLKAFSFLNVTPKIILSGRTDKDVHATGQVFNTELPPYLNDHVKLKRILNEMLPPSIQIRLIQPVSDEFHARFHATRRTYRYLVTTKPTTPFNDRYITHVKNIDVPLIKEAMKCFEGVHDFEYFHKRGSDKENLVREVYETDFYAYKDIYVFKFVANSYLRSQIRLMVGFLLAISEGKRSIEELKQQLNKEIWIHKTPAKPNGLYLAQVKY